MCGGGIVGNLDLHTNKQTHRYSDTQTVFPGVGDELHTYSDVDIPTPLANGAQFKNRNSLTRVGESDIIILFLTSNSPNTL